MVLALVYKLYGDAKIHCYCQSGSKKAAEDPAKSTLHVVRACFAKLPSKLQTDTP